MPLSGGGHLGNSPGQSPSSTWNILGIVDLVNAVTMGVTSAVVQLQAAPSSFLILIVGFSQKGGK